jgi:hypothetical protein
MESVCVGVLGAMIGLMELVSRYRDKPSSAVLVTPAWIYLGLNVGASLAALYVTFAFDLHFGLQEGPKLEFVRVLVAGLGAMAFFRSSLFTVRVGESDVAVGPGSFLQLLLDATDREVDRLRAQARAREAVEIMRNVSFEKARTALPTFCLALMQNLKPEDQTKLGQDVNALRAAEMDEATKVLVLGVILMDYVGPDVVKTAVARLGTMILREIDVDATARSAVRPALDPTRVGVKGAPAS